MPSSLPAIAVRDVIKSYPHVRALDRVSLDVHPGEFFGLLGPNGAGKTTLISILAGLARATSGSVQVMGHDVVKDYKAARRSLGVVPQELVFDPFFTVRECLRITSGYYGVKNNEAWIDEILDNLDLSAKANANMRQLSGGMKRRVLVAQALVHRPPVIILDEPTAGVDVELRQTLWKFVSRLNREGHTIVLTTHYLEEAEELCGRIAMLKGGRIVAMEPTHQLLNRIAGVQLILRAPGAEIARAQTLPEGRLLIKLPGYDEVEPVLADLRARGIKIEELEVRRADLEDVFMKIMTETQRISSLADAARLSGVAS